MLDTFKDLEEIESQSTAWESAVLPIPLQVTCATERRDTAVYECCNTALWGKRIVLTPYMLLDRLQTCAELAEEARADNLPAHTMQNRVDRIADEVERILTLLHRGGLWMDTGVEKRVACDGRQYDVLEEPFKGERR